MPPAKDLFRGLDLNEYHRKFSSTSNKENKTLQVELEPREKEAKIPRKIKYIIIIFYLSIAVGWIVLRVTLGVDIPFYVVSSGSMIPNLNVHDLVIIKNIHSNADDTSFKNLKVGDIIVFRTPELIEGNIGL